MRKRYKEIDTDKRAGRQKKKHEKKNASNEKEKWKKITRRELFLV
jgi:hypothetical protein